MKSGYLYLDETEMLLIKNSLQKNKDEDSKKLIAKIDSYKNNYWDMKNKLFNNYKMPSNSIEFHQCSFFVCCLR